jgi:hypothetical protein
LRDRASQLPIHRSEGSLLHVTTLRPHQPVSHTPARFEQLRRPRGQLGAQAHHVDVDGPLAAAEVDSPDEIEQTVPREERPAMGRKEAQQIELARGERSWTRLSFRPASFSDNVTVRSGSESPNPLPGKAMSQPGPPPRGTNGTASVCAFAYRRAASASWRASSSWSLLNWPPF